MKKDMGSSRRQGLRQLSALRSVPRSALVAAGAILAGMLVVVALTAGGLGVQATAIADARQPVPPAGPATAPASPSASATTPASTASFSGIVIPDVLVVAPAGLSPADVARLHAITGVRKLITFDGAQITLAGRPANVIGVRPDQFRSWVPLPTGSDQRLWTGLAAGDFIASSRVSVLRDLTPGGTYQLTGSATASTAFAGAARLGITGVGIVVNQAVSRKLGLVRQVAALISAPGPSMATLTARVRQVLGTGTKVVGLRGHQPSASSVHPAQITSYLQLFQASAAKYCPAMSWTVLAAIGQIESADGQNMGPSTAGALGPMQFMPATWAEWGIDGFGQAGPPDIMNPFDAVPSAARMLCADGASAGTAAGLRQAIFAYNHADWYVNEVLALAARYAAEYH